MMKQFNLGLEASKLLSQTLEVALPETEKSLVRRLGEDKFSLIPTYAIELSSIHYEDIFPSPSLSELSEVFRLLGEKKGWGDRENGWRKIPKWKDRYDDLCQIWRDTQSQERCDEFVINLIQK